MNNARSVFNSLLHAAGSSALLIQFFACSEPRSDSVEEDAVWRFSHVSLLRKLVKWIEVD